MAGLNATVASLMAPAIAYLPWSSARIETLLAQRHLPPLLAHQQVGLVPLEGAAGFIYDMAELTGEPTFGFDAITHALSAPCNALSGFTTWPDAEPVAAARHFVQQMDGVVSNVHFFCLLRRDMFWIYRTPKSSSVSESWTMTQYNLAVLLAGMRLIFGPGLRPAATETCLKAPPRGIPQDLQDVNLTHGKRRVGIGFRIADLVAGTRRPRTRPRTAANPPGPLPHLEGATPDSIAACIEQFLASGQTDKLAERTAGAFGLSLRSYQRRLGALGTTHSRMRDHARLQQARVQLWDDRRSVTQIALDLGYAHVGDFTRFFRSQTGQTPTEYRRTL